ncbi:MAG: transporter [Planctomycetia bacterium]|nr:MAG: transporter [Planctomycetia bacterium]
MHLTFALLAMCFVDGVVHAATSRDEAGASAAAVPSEPPNGPQREGDPVAATPAARDGLTDDAHAVEAVDTDAHTAREPLVSDRPDFTESTSVVSPGRYQWEGGYTFTRDSENGRRSRDHTLAELLLRTGVTPGVELRFGWAGASFTTLSYPDRSDAGRRVHQRDHEDGWTDMTIGFKAHLAEQRGWRPELAVIGALALPTGSISKSSGDVDPEVKWLWSYAIDDRLSIGGNLNIAVPTGARGRFAQASASLAIGYSVCEHLGVYAEYFGFYPGERGEDCAHTVNGGFAVPVTDDLQLDLRIGVGLNEQADDFFAGVGFAVRF